MKQSLTNNRSMKENKKVKMQGAKGEERWRDGEMQRAREGAASCVFKEKLI
jgi:hypothetical protein